MTLVKVASVVGVATVTMAFIARGKISDNVKNTEYYKEALAILRKHKGAISLLGEPIKARTINVGDESKNFTKDDVAQYQVPVYGSKDRGTLHFWAEKDPSQDKWTVSRVELVVDKEPYRKLLIRRLGKDF